MTSPSTADWLRLGKAVLARRLARGYGDTKVWADVVGRSTRQLLGLERGEHVGSKTLALIEIALEWDAGTAFGILQGGPIPGPAIRISSVGATAFAPAPDEDDVEPAPDPPSVLNAISQDPNLLPEARAHLLNQYKLLLRIQAHSSDPEAVIEEARNQEELATERRHLATKRPPAPKV